MNCSRTGSSVRGISQALPVLSPGALPNSRVELRSSALAGGFFTTSAIWELPVAAAKSLQLCPTLCGPIDSSPPGSPIPGILQARTLEWVAISFSNAWKWKVKVKSLSFVWLLATPWTAAYQPPPSIVFSRQEYWSGVKPTTMYKIDNNENWLYYTGNSIQWSVVTTEKAMAPHSSTFA